MRYGLLADVHGNLPALDAVLGALGVAGVDGLLCAGDIVGYGPFPDECVARIAASGAVTVAGNHDLIAVGRLSSERCGRLARETLAWTRRRLGREARDVLIGLPLRAEAGDGIILTHGALGDPQRYVHSADEALAQLGEAPAARTLVLGHTHVPLVVGDPGSELLRGGTGTVELGSSSRHAINPGAVGQSRSRDGRARAAVLDTEARTVQLVAVDYDVGATRAALRAARLPPWACHVRPARFPGEYRLREIAGRRGGLRRR